MFLRVVNILILTFITITANATDKISLEQLVNKELKESDTDFSKVVDNTIGQKRITDNQYTIEDIENRIRKEIEKETPVRVSPVFNGEAYLINIIGKTGLDKQRRFFAEFFYEGAIYREEEGQYLPGNLLIKKINANTVTLVTNKKEEKTLYLSSVQTILKHMQNEK